MDGTEAHMMNNITSGGGGDLNFTEAVEVTYTFFVGPRMHITSLHYTTTLQRKGGQAN